MRTFYQGKLRKMTVQLREEVAEKNFLEQELKQYEESSQKYQDLKVALHAKEKFIDQLRNRQHEIKSLTSIASRNDKAIGNLKAEIVQMKKQKITLQKRLSQERKDHEKSLNQLKKQVSLHERNAMKAKRDLETAKLQKQRVQQIAKSHSTEISELRLKYREVEKKLRMQTLKRGVLERAGIDPVLVGRKVRNVRPQSRLSRASTAPSALIDSNGKRKFSSGDINQMQSFLDQKVAEMSRKEAAADKLAMEWEDHLELTTRKEQLMSEDTGRKDSLINDELEALDFQIQYKESRIRQLARRLSTRPKSANDGGEDNNQILLDKLIDDRKFKELTRDFTALSSAQLTSKILFGMVVKERRRVAKLARTASSLDQKALNAENISSSNEAALQAHMEESTNERVAMTQSHQERLLSLMSMLLQQDEIKTQQQSSGTDSPERHESVYLALANERIETLEKQLEELSDGQIVQENYQARESETVEKLSKLTEDYGVMLEESNGLRSFVISVRDKIADPAVDLAQPESKDRINLLHLIDNSLKGNIDARKTSTHQSYEGLKRISEYYLESEEEDDDDGSINELSVPDWAGHIMDDLSIIASGELPPSLSKMKSPKPPKGRTNNESVFDRLSNPDNYTGAQKSVHVKSFDDDMSVGSMFSARSTVRKDTASLMRIQSNSTPVRSRSRSNTPVRHQRMKKTPTPFRHAALGTPTNMQSSTPKARITDRISEILKDKKSTKNRDPSPPKVLNIPKPTSFVGNSGGKEKEGFMDAYTKKDVFERLQKNVTNSYTLAKKAADEEEHRY